MIGDYYSFTSNYRVNYSLILRAIIIVYTYSIPSAILKYVQPSYFINSGIFYHRYEIQSIEQYFK